MILYFTHPQRPGHPHMAQTRPKPSSYFVSFLDIRTSTLYTLQALNIYTPFSYHLGPPKHLTVYTYPGGDVQQKFLSPVPGQFVSLHCTQIFHPILSLNILRSFHFSLLGSKNTQTFQKLQSLIQASSALNLYKPSFQEKHSIHFNGSPHFTHSKIFEGYKFQNFHSSHTFSHNRTSTLYTLQDPRIVHT